MLKIPPEKLKKFLIDDGIVQEADFAALEQEAARRGQSLADVLISKGVITGDYYTNILASFYGVPVAGLDPSKIDLETLNLIDEEFARSRRVVAFGREKDGSVNIAMEEPSDLNTIQYLETKLKTKINPFLSPAGAMARIFAFYSKQHVESFKKIIQENIRASLSLSKKKDEEAATEVPIISITDNLIAYAVSLKASDIHIEALEKEVLVRYRIDGVLHEIIRIQKDIHPAIVARFKILGSMKLDEHAKPQDGRFKFKSGDEEIDVRVSILPTFYGEKVEMRLLLAKSQLLSLEELGMLEDTIKGVVEASKKTFGMVLVTGPTGSGKSTTLYSVLNILNRPEVNIVTVEDPVEYDMKYINQTNINEAAGITFASALRSILRQDPNIIMVGEIRDRETAEISVHAALTGHLLLSTLHTNDAPTAIPRLIDMRIEPFLLSAVLNAVLAQRLVRKICIDCLYSYQVTEEIASAIRQQIQALNLSEKVQIPKTLFRGKGCVSCGNTGYRGRMGIFELLVVDDEVRKYIVNPQFTLSGLRDLARSAGMRSMFEDGLIKAGQGKTTIEEILRVIRE